MVDDSAVDAELILHELYEAGCHLAYELVDNADDTRRALGEKQWDIIFCDYSMPNFDPYMVLDILRETELDIPLIVISGTIGENNAIKLLKAGCHDCIMKSDLRRLPDVIKREINEAIVRKEKEKRAAELLIANQELAYQNEEKGKRAAELLIANQELAYQNEEKGKRAAELLIANQELAYQNEEKEKRAAELLIANQELAYQNEEKGKRAAELLIANQELAYQNEEKEKRAAELLIAKKELAFQNEEKRLIDELKIKTGELEQFFTLNLDLLCIADLDGNFIKVNKAWESILGYSDNELEKRKFLEFVHPEDINATLDAMSQLGKDEQILKFKNRYRCQDGTYRIIEWHSQLGGHLIYAAARDVTELTEKEEQLKQEAKRSEELKREAEKATEAKSEFLSNMSHEIRTPINAIVGFTELALKTSLTPQQGNYLNKIKASSHALIGIIGDILDISKLEAGKMELEARPFKLEEMLQVIIAQISAVSQAKGLELLVSIAEDVPASLIGDSLRLGQVLTNLISNAVKFTDEGEVIIGIKLLKNGGSSALLQFTVKDTGIGLTQEQINNLFQPFNQAETSTTRKYGGTGLGLAISRNLVSLMGGEIWVESEAGKGSTFFVTVRFDIAEKGRFRSFKNAFAMWNMKVLVVDDILDSQEIMKSMLTGMAFDVTTCSSGEEAVELIKEAATVKGYDLVIMDWKMPGMDGIEASRRIKRMFASNEGPVIIMLTAYNSPQMRAEAKQLGVAFVLDKPVTPSLMLNTIMHIFGKEGFKQISTSRDEKLEPESLKQFIGTRVLLVEDNIINQEVAQDILQQAGLTVTVAANGKEAVNMVMSNTFDIVLMDLQMPVMDGYDATRQIRKNPAFSELPIIAMTANVLQAEREKCIQVGMNDYITKPIDTILLFRTMGHWIKENQRTNPSKESLRETEQPAATNKISANNDNGMPELDDIDSQSALNRLGGNRKLYQNLLVKFKKIHQHDIKAIRQAVDLGELEIAERLVHTIKGAAGNLGAHEVFTDAVALEAAFRGNTLENLEPLIGQLEKSMELVFTAIAFWEAKGVETSSSEHDGANVVLLMPSLEELANLLNDNDMATSDYLEAIVIQTKNTAFSDQVAQIKGLVDQYDFEGAIEILRTIQEVIKNGKE